MGDGSHLAALCGRVVERGELAENLCGLAVTQESLQQVEEIPINNKNTDSQEKAVNEHENVKGSWKEKNEGLRRRKFLDDGLRPR